jgi:hypothetical protein
MPTVDQIVAVDLINSWWSGRELPVAQAKDRHSAKADLIVDSEP